MLVQTALSFVMVFGAAALFSLPSPADPVSTSLQSKTLLLAAEPDAEDRLPPPPPIKRRGAADEQGSQFQPEPVDSGNGPGPGGTFNGDANREMIMRRRAIKQRMMQQFGQQGGQGKGFGNDPDGGGDGEMSDFPGRRMRRGMRGGFGQEGGNEPAGGGFPGQRRRAFGNEGGPGFLSEDGPPGQGFAGQGGGGMRRFRGQRSFGGDGQPGQGFGEGGQGPMPGMPGDPGAMGLPGGPDGPGVMGGPGSRRGENFGGFRQRRGAMGGGMSGGGFGGSKPLDLTPLGLTEPQKTKIQAMRQQTKLKLREIKKGLVEKQMNMRNLMFSPDASEAQIRGARRELRTLQDQMDETNLNDLLAIRSLLTPDQKKRLPDCMPGRGRDGDGPGGAGGIGRSRGPGGPAGDAVTGPTAFGASGSEAKFVAKPKSTGMYRKHAAKNANSTK